MLLLPTRAMECSMLRAMECSMLCCAEPAALNSRQAVAIPICFRNGMAEAEDAPNFAFDTEEEGKKTRPTTQVASSNLFPQM